MMETRWIFWEAMNYYTNSKILYNAIFQVRFQLLLVRMKKFIDVHSDTASQLRSLQTEFEIMLQTTSLDTTYIAESSLNSAR